LNSRTTRIADSIFDMRDGLIEIISPSVESRGWLYPQSFHKPS
jgi:hypothetical protein